MHSTFEKGKFMLRGLTFEIFIIKNNFYPRRGRRFFSKIRSIWSTLISRGSGLFLVAEDFLACRQLDVSKNCGTPKWMVYNGKPY